MSLLHPRPAASGAALAPQPAPARQAPARPALPPTAPDVGPAAAPCFAVDRLDAVDAAAHRDAWVDLVARALEPNPFLDPDFALPAAQHLAGRRRPCFVMVWAVPATGGDGRGDLVAVCPVLGRRAPLRGLAAAWLHDLSTLGLPLLDRDRADGALSALLAWAGAGPRAAAGMLLPSIPADGPTVSALRRAAAAGGLDLAVLAAWERAALRPGGGAGAGRAGLAALSAKGAKELRRQRRRLGERGALRFASAETDDALRAEVERFLCLEASGWKGAAGTAMLCSPGRTAFLRTATRLLARRGLCRIDALTLDGAPVAMAVILRAGGAEFLWKIGYREGDARCSPGVQLVLEITEAARADGLAGGLAGGIHGRPALVDSCAVPDHPMIDRLWRDRIRLCDLAVSARPGGGAGFRRAVAAERGARRLRAGAKRLLGAWRAHRARRAAPAP